MTVAIGAVITWVGLCFTQEIALLLGATPPSTLAYVVGISGSSSPLPWPLCSTM